MKCFGRILALEVSGESSILSIPMYLTLVVKSGKHSGLRSRRFNRLESSNLSQGT